ncbi:CaiB/BaiF CoA transferase family protein [Zavarzinia compransoris]|uniref:Carnitine dehydratase n=1 Tax=Zavarzinia compransoris TaxID=1264899 RepID=A0A317EAP4_9PROT|nr:CoA transferase [Zavarzinia compransoris]PWR23622.1 carnitine dehydratase [Zavarzinia compransoris]TDP47841.1 crotonobetainyl-CoA:carnitine CoA-transferase CaiB-like acyl-CoA transferase [Zavarzinia compransoris]
MAKGAPRLLEGIRIVDLTSIVFGPYCTQVLADMGADVIKVEPPAGDLFRLAGRPPNTPFMGACHMTLNRGKRSITLDLKAAADAAVMRELIAGADVFIHNVRGKAMARLGFSYDDLRAAKPDLIYVHCVGFGSDGPYADLQAYDDVIQAATGTASLLSRVDGDPRPRFLPSLIADKVAGLYGAQAVLAAVIHRLRSGEGQQVEVPMFEAFTQFMLEEHLFGAVFEPETSPVGYPRQIDPERQPFPTADGHIAIVPYTEATVAIALDLVGRGDLLADPRLSSPLGRMQNIAVAYAALREATPAKTTAAWLEIFHAHGIPAMAVRDLGAIKEDPHLKAVDFFRRVDHPTEGAYVQMRPPVKFGAVGEMPVGHAPGLGQHNDEIRAELAARRRDR